jgi:DNA-binding transcriptional LysR family regulator
VQDAAYVLADRTWHAFREPTPESLDQLRNSDTHAMPFLAGALRRFLEEYPSTRDGLSRSERRLLEIAEGGIQLAAAFPRMHAGEDAYYMGDLSFMQLIEELAATSPPLLLLEDRSFSLTDEGRDVLAGRKDRVSYGLDRWMGGVHLQSGTTPIWRWNGEKVTTDK